MRRPARAAQERYESLGQICVAARITGVVASCELAGERAGFVKIRVNISDGSWNGNTVFGLAGSGSGRSRTPTRSTREPHCCMWTIGDRRRRDTV
jgi:hypothetical protein